MTICRCVYGHSAKAILLREAVLSGGDGTSTGKSEGRTSDFFGNGQDLVSGQADQEKA